MNDEKLRDILVQYYRGEVSRANTWRSRMDRTTNWSVVITAAVITWVFSAPQRNHLVLLFGYFLVLVFLVMESRRYRFYDLWRSRIRILEEYFFSLALTDDISKPKDIDWKKELAKDLKNPRFKITSFEAITRRLKRIYVFILLVIYSAWILKLSLHPERIQVIYEIISRARVGVIPGYLVFILITSTMAFLILITFYEVRKSMIGERKAKGEIREQKEEVTKKWKD